MHYCNYICFVMIYSYCIPCCKTSVINVSGRSRKYMILILNLDSRCETPLLCIPVKCWWNHVFLSLNWNTTVRSLSTPSIHKSIPFSLLKVSLYNETVDGLFPCSCLGWIASSTNFLLVQLCLKECSCCSCFWLFLTLSLYKTQHIGRVEPKTNPSLSTLKFSSENATFIKLVIVA